MRAVVLASIFVLGACSGVPTEAIDGPYYTEGFSDGCRTAEARRASFDNRSFRNDDLFETQDSYRAGWRSGFSECQPVGIDGVQPTGAGQQDPVL